MVRIAQPEETDPFVSDARAYVRMKSAIAEMTKEADIVKARLSDHVAQYGEPDETGSQWLNLDEEIDGVVSLKRERRVTTRINEERAEELINELGLQDRCLTTVTAVDQDELMACLIEGLVTEDALNSVLDVKESWAFVPSKKTR